jgi:hypothetical protein
MTGEFARQFGKGTLAEGRGSTTKGKGESRANRKSLVSDDPDSESGTGSDCLADDASSDQELVNATFRVKVDGTCDMECVR